MKKYLLLFLLSTPLFSLAQATATAYGGGGSESTSHYGYNNVYQKGEKYIVIKLWNDDEPLTEKEKQRFSAIQQQLTSKGITSVEFKYNTRDEIQSLFAKHGITGEVSIANGLSIRTGDSKLGTSSNKLILVVENNKARSICVGDNCENNFLKTYFQLKDSKDVK
ncbi:MAG TPA: hypothetical protein VF622_17175 [Segetibacter sp.]